MTDVPATRMHLLARCGRSSSGTAAIEFAIVLPALLLFVLGLMDVGRLLWTQTALDRAVEAAARCGVVDTLNCNTVAKIKTYAAGQAFGVTIADSAFTVASTACGVQVAVAIPFKFVIPWIGDRDISLDAIACYPPPT